MKDGICTNIPYTAEDLQVVKTTLKNNAMRDDRYIQSVVTQNIDTSLSFSFEFSKDIYDFLLTSLLGGYKDDNAIYFESSTFFVSDVPHFFDMYKDIEDVGVIKFNDCYADSLRLSIMYGEMIRCQATMMSSSHNHTEVSPVVTNPVKSSPVSSTHFGVVEVEGSSTGICVYSMEVEIKNNSNSVPVLSNHFKNKTFKGNFEVVGNMELHISPESYSLYKQSLLLGKTFQLRWWIDCGGAIYEFYIPNCHLNINTPNQTSMNNDMMVRVEFEAMYSKQMNTSFFIRKHVGRDILDITMNKLWLT